MVGLSVKSYGVERRYIVFDIVWGCEGMGMII